VNHFRPFNQPPALHSKRFSKTFELSLGQKAFSSAEDNERSLTELGLVSSDLLFIKECSAGQASSTHPPSASTADRIESKKGTEAEEEGEPMDQGREFDSAKTGDGMAEEASTGLDTPLDDLIIAEIKEFCNANGFKVH